MFLPWLYDRQFLENHVLIILPLNTVCLSVCLSVRLPVCLSSVTLPINMVCLFVRPSVCLSVCPSVRPSVRPSVCLSVRPSVRLSVSPSVRPVVMLVFPRFSIICCMSSFPALGSRHRLQVFPRLLLVGEY